MSEKSTLPLEPFTVQDEQEEVLVSWDGMAGYYTKSDLPDLIRDFGEDDWRVETLQEKDDLFDEDEYQWSWDDEMEGLTRYMEEVSPKSSWGYWYCVGRNHGWMHRNGYKYARAETGKELLREMLPNTDNHFRIYYCTDANGKKGLAINNAHHDAPMGGEMYYIFSYYDEEER